MAARTFGASSINSVFDCVLPFQSTLRGQDTGGYLARSRPRCVPRTTVCPRFVTPAPRGTGSPLRRIGSRHGRLAVSCATPSRAAALTARDGKVRGGSPKSVSLNKRHPEALPAGATTYRECPDPESLLLDHRDASPFERVRHPRELLHKELRLLLRTAARSAPKDDDGGPGGSP